MSILDRVVLALFGGSNGNGRPTDAELLAELADAIVDVVEPRLRSCAGYRDKLEGGLRATISHLRAMGQVPLEPVVLSPATWAIEPHVHAFFSSAAEVTSCIARSQDLRRFLESHPDCNEVFALLGMRRAEREGKRSGTELDSTRQGDTVSAASFSDHRLVAPASDEAQARLDVGRRVVRRMAQLILLQILAVNQRGKDLQMRRADLLMKWRMLQQARNGMQVLVGDPATIEAQLAEVNRELEKTDESYYEAARSLSSLDGYIAQINGMLLHPEELVRIERVCLPVGPPGVETGGPPDSRSLHQLDLTDLHIGEGLRIAVALVRIPRAAVASTPNATGS
jgi:hypothetical protein